MCGRFTLKSDLRALELRFNFRGDDLYCLEELEGSANLVKAAAVA